MVKVKEGNRRLREICLLGGYTFPFSFVEKYFFLVFSLLIGLRPLSEVFWGYKFLGGNLQSHFTIILFFIACILLFLKRSIEQRFLPLFLVGGFFVVYIIMSTIFNYEFLFFRESLKTVTSFTIGIAVVLALPRENLKIIFVLFGISIFCLTILSYLQFLGFYDFFYFTDSVVKNKVIGRVSGGLSHPNDLNRSLIFFLFFLFFLLPKINDFLRFGIFIFFAPPVFWTYHRTTFLCTLIIIFLYLLYRRRYCLLATFLSIFLIIIVVKLKWVLYFIFDQRLNFSHGIEGSRFWYSYESIRLFSESPFLHKLFGEGIFPSGRIYGDGDFPRILYAYGVIGFLGYFGVLISIFSLFFKNVCRYKIFYGLCLFSIWLIFSLFTDVTRYPSFIIMFFVCFCFATYGKYEFQN